MHCTGHDSRSGFQVRPVTQRSYFSSVAWFEPSAWCLVQSFGDTKDQVRVLFASEFHFHSKPVRLWFQTVGQAFVVPTGRLLGHWEMPLVSANEMPSVCHSPFSFLCSTRRVGESIHICRPICHIRVCIAPSDQSPSPSVLRHLDFTTPLSGQSQTWIKTFLSKTQVCRNITW